MIRRAEERDVGRLAEILSLPNGQLTGLFSRMTVFLLESFRCCLLRQP